MQTKLICSDIDGTLLNKDRELSDKTISEIKRIAPTPFILISSRMPQAMTHLQKKLNILHLPIIAYNGGLILYKGNVVSSTEIPHKSTQSIYTFCKKTSLHISLYHHNKWYVPSMDYWAQRESNNTKVKPLIKNVEATLNDWLNIKKGAHKIMVMGDTNEIDALESFIKDTLSESIISYRSKDEYLEIAHHSISKKTAITTLLSKMYPHINMNDILAFGDNFNDIDMLISVGKGVAVANANKEVLAVADYITSTNIKDGVADYMEAYL
ncbi:MAG: HAD family phosphatase [Flavobacteriaceae bacterium]|nr:HAD family phosphatase [Flavobacteriaceae bacterium]